VCVVRVGQARAGPTRGARGRRRGALIRAAAVSPSLSGAGPAATIGRSSRTAPSTRCFFLASAVCVFYRFPGATAFPRLYVFTTVGSRDLVALQAAATYPLLLVLPAPPSQTLEQQIQLLSRRNFAIRTNKYFCATKNTGYATLLFLKEFFF